MFFFDLKTFLDEKKILFVQITTNIVETPAQLNTTSTAGGVYMKMTLHHLHTHPPDRNSTLDQQR